MENYKPSQVDRDQYVCKQCSKCFLYVSSLKKHIQHLHPEIVVAEDGQGLDAYCTIIKQEVACQKTGEKPETEEKSPVEASEKEEKSEEGDESSTKKRKRRTRKAKPAPKESESLPQQNTKNEEENIPAQAPTENPAVTPAPVPTPVAGVEEKLRSESLVPPQQESGESFEPPEPDSELESESSKPPAIHAHEYSSDSEAAEEEAKELTKKKRPDSAVRDQDGKGAFTPILYPAVAPALPFPDQVQQQQQLYSYSGYSPVPSAGAYASFLYMPNPNGLPRPGEYSASAAFSSLWMQRLAAGTAEGAIPEAKVAAAATATAKGPDCCSDPAQPANIEEQIKELPTVPGKPLAQSEHHHIHCEFCGHSMIIHAGHVDYVHDGELHYAAAGGTVHPHKLEISETNPTGCRPLVQYPWHANGPPSTEIGMSTYGNNQEPAAVEDIEKVHEVWSRYSERTAGETRPVGSVSAVVLLGAVR